MSDQFGKRGKLSPRFIWSFEILERIGTVAYRLALPPSMSDVHEVFHVSMLMWWIGDRLGLTLMDLRGGTSEHC